MLHSQASRSGKGHVGVISHGFQTAYERGFCNGLAANGLNVTLISSDRTDYRGLDANVHAVNLRGSQTEARSAWKKLANMACYHLRLLGWVVRQRHPTLHVIGLTQPPFLCGVIEGLWFRLFARNYVLTIHNLLPHERHTRWMWGMHWLTYRLPSQIVVHTLRMKEELNARFGIATARITVMEHGIEPLPTSIEPLLNFPRSHKAEAPLRLLFFGIVTKYKGLDLLLDALRNIEFPFSLMIAGHSANATLVADLRSRIALLPEGTVTWRNEFVAEEEIAPLFLDSDAIVLPYRHIDQSGVLFQALRFGRPVVAARVGALQHYVSESVGETFVAESADALTAALGRLRERLPDISPSQIIGFGNRYHWTSTVKALASSYRGFQLPLSFISADAP